jgi:UDP-N-acetylglucosamine:LPS N-acetylglucosamine transferase
MALALAAADVAVTRAGAGTCAELAAFGVPAVMVPLPIATRDHQTANAAVLVDAGGAVVVPDAELDVDRLEAELGPLVDDAPRRRAMATAMAGLGRLDAAERAAVVVEEVARG